MCKPFTHNTSVNKVIDLFSGVREKESRKIGDKQYKGKFKLSLWLYKLADRNLS